MHAGGVLADSLVGKQSLQSLRAVFAPKVTLAVPVTYLMRMVCAPPTQ